MALILPQEGLFITRENNKNDSSLSHSSEQHLGDNAHTRVFGAPNLVFHDNKTITKAMSNDQCLHNKLTYKTPHKGGEWYVIYHNISYMYSAYLDPRENNTLVRMFGTIRREHITGMNSSFCQLWTKGSLTATVPSLVQIAGGINFP